MLCIYPSHQSKNGCVPFSEFLDLKHRLRPSFEIVATPGPIKLLTEVKSCRLRDDEKSENAQFSASILCQRGSSALELSSNLTGIVRELQRRTIRLASGNGACT